MQRTLLILFLLLALCLLYSRNHSLGQSQTGGSVDPPHALGAVGLNVESYRTNAQGQQLELIRQSILNQDINFDWQSGPILDTGLNNDVLLNITGYLKPRVSGRYQFFVESDDGVSLTIDGIKVIDEWKIQASAQSSTDFIDLDSSRFHSFELRWYEHEGDAVLKLYWTGIDTAGVSIVGRSVVPIDVFYQTLPVEAEAEEEQSRPEAEAEAEEEQSRSEAEQEQSRSEAEHVRSGPEPDSAPTARLQPSVHVATTQLENEVDHVHQDISEKIAANVQALKEIRGRLDLRGSINESDETIVRKVNDRVQSAETELNNRLAEIRRQQEVLEIRLTRLLESQSRPAGDGSAFNETVLAGHEQRLNGIEGKLFNIKGVLTEVKMILNDIASKADNGYRCQVSNNLCDTRNRTRNA